VPESELAPPAAAQAARAIQPAAPPHARAQTLRQMQHAYGNQRVQELLASLRGGGHPLDPATRSIMEAALGARLNDVRVHAGPEAQAAAAELGVRAFTAGENIYFAAGAYDPGSSIGLELLAHELAHFIQQRRGGTRQPGEAQEQDADRAADAFAGGQSIDIATGSAPGVPQGGPNEALDELLVNGPDMTPPRADQVQAAVERVNRGTATLADQQVIMRQTVADARAFLRAEKGQALSSTILCSNCGPGRDVSSASFGSLVAESPQAHSVVRFQALDVFGRGTNQHVFSVVTFANGKQYIVDPTFAQFLKPGTGLEAVPGTSAQVLRADPAGARFARDLVQNGFVQLNPENARLYARALGVPEADAGRLGGRLIRGENAVMTELVGRGSQTTYRVPPGGADVVDRAEVVRYIREDQIPKLQKAGDPGKLIPRLRELAARLEEAPVRPPPVGGGGGGGGGPKEAEGPGGAKGGGVGGLAKKGLLAYGLYSSGKRLKEAWGTDEFGITVAQEGMIWGSAATPLGPAGPPTVGFMFWYGDLFGRAIATVLEALPGALEALDTFGEYTRSFVGSIFFRHTLVHYFALDHENWDYRSMPKDLIPAADALGAALWDKLGKMQVEAFRDAIHAPAVQLVSEDVLKQYAKLTLLPAPVNQVTPIQLVISLKSNKLRFMQDPEWMADYDINVDAPELEKGEATRLKELVEIRAGLDPYNWDLSELPNIDTRDQDKNTLREFTIALWGQLENLDRDEFQRMSLMSISSFTLSPDLANNAAASLGRLAIPIVELGEEGVQMVKDMLLKMTPQDLLRFMKDNLRLRFKQDPGSIAAEAVELVRRGYQPW
jgi:hypothetical protein